LSGFGVNPPRTITTESLAIHWSGRTGNYTFGTGTLDKDNATDSSIESAGSTPITFTGDFRIDWTMTTQGGSTSAVGVFPISEDSTFLESDNQNRGDMDQMTNSWYFYESTTAFAWFHAGVSKDSITASDGDTFAIKRVGSIITTYQNGSLDHTYVQTSSVELRMCIGDNDAPFEIDGLSWTV